MVSYPKLSNMKPSGCLKKIWYVPVRTLVYLALSVVKFAFVLALVFLMGLGIFALCDLIGSNSTGGAARSLPSSSRPRNNICDDAKKLPKCGSWDSKEKYPFIVDPPSKQSDIIKTQQTRPSK